MTVYAITHDGLFKNIAVNTIADRASAETFIEASKKVAGSVVESEDDLATMSGPALVALYNALEPDATVSRFTTRGDGARRAFALLEAKFQHQPIEVAVAETLTEEPTANSPEEGNDMAAKKGKKAKAAPKKAVCKTGDKKPRSYKTEVKTSGGAASKEIALGLIQRANGATAQQIADKLDCSLGTAKNLVWYLRRDGKKIVCARKTGVFSI